MPENPFDRPTTGTPPKEPAIEESKASEISASEEKMLEAAVDRFSEGDRFGPLHTLPAHLHPRFAFKLIDAGDGQFVLENMQWFGLTEPDRKQIMPEYQKKIARMLLRSGPVSVLTRHLAQFTGLDKDVAVRMIEAGLAENVIQNRKSFTGFHFDKDIFFALLDHSQTQVAVDNIDIFTGLDKEVALFLIMRRQERTVLAHLSKFSGLDGEIASRLLDNGFGTSLVLDLEKFTGVDYTDLAVRLIGNGDGEVFREYYDKFETLDARTLAWLRFKSRYPGEEVLQKQFPAEMKAAPDDPYWKALEQFENDKTIPLNIKKSKEVDQAINDLVMASENLDLDIGGIFRARHTHGISPVDYWWISVRYPAALELDQRGNIKTEELAAAIQSQMDSHLFEGDDITQEYIAQAFRKGITVFGAEAMLKYMNRPDLSRHDALLSMDNFVSLQEVSGLSPEKFANNILLQVAKDGASYDGTTAHYHFTEVVDTLKVISVEDVFKKAERFKNIKKLHDLIVDFESTSPFTNWKTLKKFYEIQQLLGRSELLEELNAGEIPVRLKQYIETLAFHPGINTQKVIEFWKETEKFLEIDDAHTPEQINAVKKPSNLLSLPYLGLKGGDLRDALVNGELDELQTLPPMERRYYFGVPSKEQTEDSAILHHAMRKALGEKSRDIKGAAANVPKLFKDVQGWCKENKLDMKVFFSSDTGPALLGQVSSNEQDSLRDLLFDKNIGIRGEQEVFQIYRAKLGLKSDPSMVVAGNDTASCMPFGSGKNNVYMFNPTYAQMVVERQVDENTWRTAAQSVTTIDHETSTPTPTLMAAYLQEGQHIKDLVKPGDLEKIPVLTLDNIEPSKNEEGNRVQNLHDVYQQFFTEYLSLNAEKIGVSRSCAAIGTGYTPANLGFRSVENRYVPVAPAGYSDNVHEKCFLIDSGLPEVDRKFKRLEPLTTRDAMTVGVLEGKAFADNPTLLAGFHQMQYNLIGMEIANKHFNRPNLSFIYRDVKTGSPLGYILAYEGKQEEHSFVYIDDLAADPKSQIAGGRLINQFFSSYLKNYGTVEKPFIPIFANARETTSYPIIQRNAERLAEQQGLMARLVELGTSARGEDTMHNVIILVGKTEEELNQQEEWARALA